MEEVAVEWFLEEQDFLLSERGFAKLRLQHREDMSHCFSFWLNLLANSSSLLQETLLVTDPINSISSLREAQSINDLSGM